MTFQTMSIFEKKINARRGSNPGPTNLRESTLTIRPWKPFCSDKNIWYMFVLHFHVK